MIWVLILARSLQGVAIAMLSPSGLAMSLNEVPKDGFFPQIELNQSWLKGKRTERIDGDSAGGTFFIPCGDDGYASSKP